MTVSPIATLTRLASYAMFGIPHADPEATLDGLRHLSDSDKDKAMRCYAAIVGERQLPAHLGRTHLEARIPARREGARKGAEILRKRGIARRAIEARRDGVIA